MAPSDYTAREVCAALDADQNPASGWVKWTVDPGALAMPREIWLEDRAIWVRTSGRVVTGWQDGHFVATWFGPIRAFRIRRAVRRWAARRS